MTLMISWFAALAIGVAQFVTGLFFAESLNW